MFSRLRRRQLWPFAPLILGMLLSMLVVGWLTWRHALLNESEIFQRQLEVRAQVLTQRVDRFRTLPEVLSLDTELRQALQRMGGEGRIISPLHIGECSWTYRPEVP